MAHMNDGSIPSGDEHTDFILYPIVEDGGLYSNQYSQQQYHTAGEVIYDPRSTVSEVDYTTLLSGDSAIDDLHSASSAQTRKAIPTNFYSLSDSTASAYQSHPFCLQANVDPYEFQSSYNIPRTIGPIFTTSAEESTIAASLDENPRFLIQAPTFPIGIPIGSHTEASDYRSTPSASPATSVGGFERAGSRTTHSSINSAVGSLGSSRSSTHGSPFSTHEDLWSTGVVGTVGTIELEQQQQPYWGGNGFINPLDLTNTSPQQTAVEEPVSSATSPSIPPASPHIPPNPSSPPASRKKTTGRLSPFASGRSHPTFPYPPPRRDSIKSTTSSRGSKSPRLENPDEASRMRSPSSPTGQQQAPTGRDVLCPECGKTFRDMR
jgi:hypothetical protein